MLNSDVYWITYEMDVTYDLLCWITMIIGLYVGWFEIPHDVVGLPELYGLKCENLITLVIVFVLVLL
jgi:hypothetical protein